MTYPQTHQEIYDTVMLHLWNQNARAISPDTLSCAYRSPDGMKCAVGCLISDEDYREEYENTSVGGLLIHQEKLNLPSQLQRFIEENQPLLRNLQKLHDRTLDPDVGDFRANILKRSNEIAREFGLKAFVPGAVTKV